MSEIESAAGPADLSSTDISPVQTGDTGTGSAAAASNDADSPTPSGSNSEAAKYRVQRNEARAERDALAAQLDAYRRRECEATVAEILEQPADLWEFGRADLTSFYDDDGELKEAELRAAAGALAETRPGLAKPRQAVSWGQHSGSIAPAAADWSQIIGRR